MLEAGIYLLLTTEPSIAVSVGDRVSAVLTDSKCLPAITFHVVGGSSDPTFETSGLQRLRIQFDVFGKGYLEAAKIRDDLRKFLNGYRGVTPDGTFVSNVDLIQHIDFFEDGARDFRCSSEYYFYFTYSS